MTDLTPFQAAVIRICTINQAFKGIGLLLKPNLALTCAHVVTDALRLPRTHTDIPTEPIKLNRPGFNAQEASQYVTATVLPNGWFPRDATNGLADIALLTLIEPLTDDVHVQLSPAFSLSGLAFVAWVGQDGHSEHLIDINGIIGREEGNGRYRLDVRDSNYKIRPGCSGAPVVEPQTGLVLGLIVQEELEEEREAGFLIPVRQLHQALQQAAITGHLEQLPGLETVLDWSKQRYKSWWRKQADIVRFIQAYCHKPEEPKPFVGRDVALQTLDVWFNQNKTRLLLLSGGAGRGKSALLLHWLAKRLHSDDCTVLFLPISIRFATNDETIGIRLLHTALCDVFSELKTMPQKPELTDYLDRIYEAWEFIANRPKQTFLLVIDGIDEATNQWFVEQRIIPPELPTNLRMLLSARHKPEQADGSAWLEDLGYSSAAQRLELSTLEKIAMAEAVVQLGHPLDQLAEREAFVTELYRLTDEGDPLLLSLWLGQIWQHRDKAPNFEAETLQTLQPSFKGFYELWSQAQQKIWQAQGLAIHPDDFDWVMRVLAFAHAPLLRDELFDLLKRLPLRVAWEYEKLRDALESAHRLVIGDGKAQGYVLVHPRLTQYFRESVKITVARQLHGAFLAWGAETVALLNQSEIPPEDCPVYVLQQYLAHIKAANLEVKEALEQHYLPLLLEGGWHQAWEESEEGLLGFLKDLQQVFEVLQAYNRDCYERNAYFEMHLAMELRCILISVSIHTLTGKIPVDLVVDLARVKIWSFARAERVAEQYAEVEKQLKCLTKLAAIAPEKESKKLHQKALQVAIDIQSARQRAEALIAVANQLQGNEQHVLRQILQATESIHDNDYRHKVIQAVKAIQDKESCTQTLDDYRHEIIQAVNAIQEQERRTQALGAMAGQLQDEKEQLQQTLQAAMAIQDEFYRAYALIVVARQLQGEKELLQQTLQAAMAIQDEFCRAYALIAVARQLQGEKELLQQTLQAAMAIQDEFDRADVLIAVAGQLQGKKELLQQALQATMAIQDEFCRADTLSAVAGQLQDEKELLQQALQAAMAIQDEFYRADALSAVAVQLHGEKKLLQQALQAAMAIQNELCRADALSAVVGQLQGEKKLLQQALQAATAIQNKETRPYVLSAVARQLQGEIKQQVLLQALQAAEELRHKYGRSKALSVVARQLQGKVKQHALRQALQAATAIRDKYERAKTLSELAKQLPGKAKSYVFQQSLQTVITIQNEEECAKALNAVVAMLQGETELLQQALQAADTIYNKAIQNEGYYEEHIKALNAVAEQLHGHPELQKSCLEMALKLPSDELKDRVTIIAELTRQNANLLTYDIWIDWLQHAPRKRPELLEVMGELTQAAVQLTGNPNQALEIARAIIDVGRWWP